MRRLVLTGAFTLALCLQACIVTTPARGLYHGASLAGKMVYKTGRGVWTVGRLTVRAADGVLDGTEQALRLTIRTARVGGEIAVFSYEIAAISLDDELSSLERNEAVLEVVIERVK